MDNLTNSGARPARVISHFVGKCGEMRTRRGWFCEASRTERRHAQGADRFAAASAPAIGVWAGQYRDKGASSAATKTVYDPGL
ncbi:hypothetical protein D1821_05410 [Phaeobacter inhibens]|nr:hypothetical protein D1821_05410 [Phaeobacter inhibens]